MNEPGKSAARRTFGNGRSCFRVRAGVLVLSCLLCPPLLAAGPSGLAPLQSMQPLQRIQPSGPAAPSATAPLAAAVTPGTVMRGQTVNLTISGRNFNTRTEFRFGEGIRPLAAPMILNDGMAQVMVEVAAGAPLGTRLVVAASGNQRHEGPARLVVGEGAAAGTGAPASMVPGAAAMPGQPGGLAPLPILGAGIASLQPNQWVVGQNYSISLSGSGFAPGMEVNFGDRIRLRPGTTVTVLNSGAARAEIEIAADAIPGPRPLSLRFNPRAAWQKTQATAWLMPQTQVMSGKAPDKPKLVAFQVPVVKPGDIELLEPLPIKSSDNSIVTPPLIRDNVAFKWKEKNPGYAHYFEFRIYDKNGKLLVKRQVSAAAPDGAPPTYYQPDGAFMAELLQSHPAPSGPVSASQSAVPAQYKLSPGAKSGGTASQGGEASIGDLQWEVAGYRRYRSDGALWKMPQMPGARAEASSGSEAFLLAAGPTPFKSDVIQPVLPGGVRPATEAAAPAETREVLVELSKRSPLFQPNRPNGLNACPLDGKSSSLQLVNRDKGNLDAMAGDKGKADPDTLTKMADYVGDRFVLLGQVNLNKSPYGPDATGHDQPASLVKKMGAQLNAQQSSCSGPNCQPQIVIPVDQQPDYFSFNNLFVDWGDGTLQPMSIKSNPASAMEDPESLGKLPDISDYGAAEKQGLLSGMQGSAYPMYYQHAFPEPRSYTVRVYQIAGGDAQQVDEHQLTQASGADHPYLRLGARPAGAQSAQAIADRAYMLFCATVKVEPYSDPVARGPLQLQAAEITGFGPPQAASTAMTAGPKGAVQAAAKALGAGKSGAGQVGPAQASLAKAGTPHPGGSSPGQQVAAPALSQAALQAASGVDAECSGCNKAFVARGKLSYVGSGCANITWKVRIKGSNNVVSLPHPGSCQIPPSPSRTGDPRQWKDPLPGSFPLVSPPLPVDQADIHEIWIDARVAPNPLDASLIQGLRKGGGVAGAALTAVGGGRKAPRVGELRPWRSGASKAPAAAYYDLSAAKLDTAPGKPAQAAAVKAEIGMQARTGLMDGPPNHVASAVKRYRVRAIDPQQPCAFLFAGEEDDRFTIYLDQANPPKESGPGKFSGQGTMALRINTGANGLATEAPVAVNFSSWGVNTDSGEVAPGTTLSQSASVPLAPRGMTARLSHLDGVAGQKMEATLANVRLNSKYTLAQGSNDPVAFASVKAPLRASGDWYASVPLPGPVALGKTGFYLYAPQVALDLSHAKGERPGACGGESGATWTGVHFGDAEVEPNTMGTKTVKVKVADWGVGDHLCGKMDIAQRPDLQDLPLQSGRISFERIFFAATAGSPDIRYDIGAWLPGLDVRLEGQDMRPISDGEIMDWGKMKPEGDVARTYGQWQVNIPASSFRFGSDPAGGWRVVMDPRLSFRAEGKPFVPQPVTVSDMRLNMDGRFYFGSGGATTWETPLSGQASLGQTNLDLQALRLTGHQSGDGRLSAAVLGKLHLSQALPAADVTVNYQLAGLPFAGSGPVNAPFSVKTAFPAGQPTVDAAISPVYKPSPNPGTRYEGSVDLGMFGGPPIKGEFLLGYTGSTDYWLTRLSIPLGETGTPIYAPYVYLYQIRGGLGYHVALDAFKDPGSLSSAKPDPGVSVLFMAGLRVGSSDGYAYNLDGDFTVAFGKGGGRMDFRAWLLKAPTGGGDFKGYFQYAGGNFDGRLWGHLGLLADTISLDMGSGENDAAVDLHFGGGWHIYAGKREGPRIRGKVLVADTDSYMMLGDSVGLAVGGAQHLYLGVGSSAVASAFIKGYMDMGLQVTSSKATGDFAAGAQAGVCVAVLGCETASVTAAVHAEAPPVKVRAHATIDFPWPAPSVSFDVNL